VEIHPFSTSMVGRVRNLEDVLSLSEIHRRHHQDSTSLRGVAPVNTEPFGDGFFLGEDGWMKGALANFFQGGSPENQSIFGKTSEPKLFFVVLQNVRVFFWGG